MKSGKSFWKIILFGLLLVALTLLLFRISNAERFLKGGQLTTAASIVAPSHTPSPIPISNSSDTPTSTPAISLVEDDTAQPLSETDQVYLPTIINGNPKFLGIIMPVYWSAENVAVYMPEADGLAGKKHSIVGWFIDLQDPAFYEPWKTAFELGKNNLYRQLEQLWLSGYVSFVKIGSTTTIREIADGQYDDRLNQMAQIYKRWLQNGEGRKAIFAPFQEMNGDWVPYYHPDAPSAQKQQDFKDAYRHVLEVFQENGIDRSRVWWMFGPNGSSYPEENFEYYYPGHEFVDLVGFASYNFGFCDATVKSTGEDFGRWENYETIYEPYISRMQAMAPSKPIIITETGTSALTSKENRESKTYDYEMKAEWLKINYAYLASKPSVLGVFYFDYNDLGNNVYCDLGIPRSDFLGYQNSVAGPEYKYIPMNDLDRFIP
jgi:hypothetical protein